MKTKKIVGWIMAIAFAVVLTGCADHTATWMAKQEQVNQDNKAILSAYFSSQSTRDAAIIQKINDPTALAMYSMIQGQRDSQVVTAFKTKNIPRPTNGWDVGKVFVGSTIPTFVKWGFGYLIADDLINGLTAAGTATYDVGGDYINMDANLNAGDDIFTKFNIDNSTGLEVEPLDLNPMFEESSGF